MNSIFRKIIKGLGAHLSDDDLARLISDELSGIQTLAVQKHLAKCWQCRSRCEQLEGAVLGFVEYRKRLIAPNLPQSPQYRNLFFAALRQHAQAVELSQEQSSLISLRRLMDFKNMNPVMATMLILLFAASLVFLVWQRNIPQVSANELLERAGVWDTSPAKDADHGVLYQKIRVRTSTRTLERSLYRDIEGHRHPKPQPLDAEDAQLKIKLAVAGVDWDEPLSPRNYKTWHDRLQNKKDEVTSDRNLLILRTTIPDGIAEKESLTVRKGDFHPLERTVIFRNAETVEITEVNYDVLSWSAVSDSLFEPLPGHSSTTVATVPSAPALSQPISPTKEQLVSAELQVLLTLNHLNADTGEQIRVSRSGTGVLVKGIVETNQRKQELMDRLDTLPDVSSSILSLEEIDSDSGHSIVPKATSVQQYTVVSMPSPLEKYFHEQSRSVDDLNRVSHMLLDASVSIRIEGSSVADLLERFKPDSDLGGVSASALNELISRHLERLSTGLAQEKEAIAQIGMSSLPPLNSEDITSPDTAVQRLSIAIERNRTLCRELITGESEPTRPVAAIVGDLLDSVNQVGAISTQLLLQQRTPTSPSDGLQSHIQKR